MSNYLNLLTFSRIIIAVAIFLSLISPDGYLLALILFFVAGITDYFDGYLARKYNLVSQIGEILDPLADKILVVFVIIGLSINLSSFYIGFMGSIIISREIWISGLRDFNARNNMTSATAVTFLAKVKTTVQLFTISLYLLALFLDIMLMIIIADIFLLISVLITIYTGYIYTYNSLLK